MSSLMLTDEETILLQEADFPKHFIDKHHQDDYISSRIPIKEFYFHKLVDHNRLILRISFRLKGDIYIYIFI